MLMKKMHRIFLLFATTLPLLFSGVEAAEVESLQSPDIRLKNIEILSIGLDGALVAIKLEVNNPNAEDIEVETIHYQVKLNGTEVKRGVLGSINKVPTLPGLETRDISVNLMLGYDSALPSILEALNNPASSTYEISGRIKISGEQDAIYFSHKDKVVLASPTLPQ